MERAPHELGGGPDEHRWGVLWQHRDDLLRLARWRVPSQADAEDIVHDALALAAARPEIRLDTAGAWLNRVVRNKAADLARERAHHHRRILYQHRTTDTCEPCDERVCDEDEARYLRSRLAQLPPRQRSALLLTAEGLSVGQVAEAMAATPKAVENLLRKARVALRSSVLAFSSLLPVAGARVRRRAQVLALALTGSAVIYGAFVRPVPADAPVGVSGTDAVAVAVAQQEADWRVRTVLGPSQSVRRPSPQGSGSHVRSDDPWLDSVRLRIHGSEIGTPTVEQKGPFTEVIREIQACLRDGLEVTAGYVGCRAAPH